MRRTLSLLLALVLLLSALPMAVSAAVTGDLADTGASYGLWLGDTQVTDANKNDILGDGGKAKFDPSTHTLTLNGPTITGEHNDCTIFCNGFDLNVKGIYSMSAAQSDIGIWVCDYALTLNGYFVFYGWSEAVTASHDITVSGGTLAARLEDGSSWQNGAIISDSGNLIFGDDVDGVEAKVTSTSSTLCAVNYGTEGSVVMSSKLRLMTPDGGQFREGRCYYYSSGRTRLAKEVVITRANPSDVKYDVWVGSTQVTAANKNDILGDGKASYDPLTATLTLNDPLITVPWAIGSDTYNIYAKSDLTVKGSYTMTSYAVDCALYCVGNLTLDGDFTLMGVDYGVYALYDINIAGGSLVGKSSNTTWVYSGGVYSSGGHIVIGSSVTRVEAEGGKTYAIYANRGLTIPSELAVIEPKDSNVTRESVEEKVTGGNVIAKHVVIGKPSDEPDDPIEAQPDDDGEYGVYIRNIAITTANKDDVLGDGGKVRFDPATSTLILNDPVMPDYQGDGYNSQIHSNIPLIIKGSYHMPADSTFPYGLKCRKVTLDGDFTFRGAEKYGVESNSGGLTIKSGSVKAVGAKIGIYAVYDGIVIEDGVTRVSAEGGDYAIQALYSGTLKLGDNTHIDYPSGGMLSDDMKSVADSYGNIAKRAVIRAGAPSAGDEKYYIWVGNTRVTSANKDDILNDGGKAKFDPATGTLTLNAPTIVGAYNNYEKSAKIYASIPLTVKGSYHMIEEVGDYGLRVDNNGLTLDGDFTFMGELYGVSANDKILINGGTLKAVGGKDGIHAGSDIVISDSVRRIEAYGEDCAIYAYLGKLIIGDGLKIEEPEYATLPADYPYIIDKNNEKAKHVVIVPGTSEPLPDLITYDLWLGDRQVTSYNKDDILDDGGKAKFDPDTCTLTLSDPTITGYASSLGVIYAEGMDLTIMGSLDLSVTVSRNCLYVKNGGLTLDGDFRFVAYEDDLYAVYASNDVTVRGGSLFAESASANGIACSGKLTFGEDVTRFEAINVAHTGSYVYAISARSYDISDALEITAPEGAALTDNTFKYPDGSPAWRLVIEPKSEKPTEPAVDRLLGDADNNGIVNVFDASYIQKGLTGSKGYPEYSKLDKNDVTYRAADADGDGTVNIFDAALIQKFLTGAASAQSYGIGELLKG